MAVWWLVLCMASESWEETPVRLKCTLDLEEGFGLFGKSAVTGALDGALEGARGMARDELERGKRGMLGFCQAPAR